MGLITNKVEAFKLPESSKWVENNWEKKLMEWNNGKVIQGPQPKN